LHLQQVAIYFYNHIEQYEAVGLQQLIEDGNYPYNNSDIFFCGNTSSLNSNCASTLRHHNAIIGKTEDKSYFNFYDHSIAEYFVWYHVQLAHVQQFNAMSKGVRWSNMIPLIPIYTL
ncbi:hypothetical protein T4A_13811, partial [Trichinella pseudospiralis]